MKRFISISARLLLMILAVAAVLAAKANSNSLDERINASLNAVILNVRETEDPIAKRQLLGNFLTRMDQGIGTAKSTVSEKDGRALDALRLKLQADYAELNGFGTAKVPDAELNSFASYVQQDMEQADYVYISVGGLIIVLLLLLLLISVR